MFSTAAFRPSASLMGDLFSTLNETLTASSPAGVTWVVALEPLAAAMLPASKTKRKNVLGLNPNENGFGKLRIMHPSFS